MSAYFMVLLADDKIIFAKLPNTSWCSINASSTKMLAWQIAKHKCYRKHYSMLAVRLKIWRLFLTLQDSLMFFKERARLTQRPSFVERSWGGAGIHPLSLLSPMLSRLMLMHAQGAKADHLLITSQLWFSRTQMKINGLFVDHFVLFFLGAKCQPGQDLETCCSIVIGYAFQWELYK